MPTPAGHQFIQIIDTTGPLAGATCEYYDLSDVAQNVFSDAVLSASMGAVLNGANASDSKGRFPLHFLNPNLSYKRIIKTSAGATWRTDNPVQTAETSLADYMPLAGVAPMTGPLNQAEGSAVASAPTINLNAATGNMVHVSGSTGISSMTLTAGYQRWLVFDGAVTLTHSANLILPGSADITTAAGDMALVIGEGAGVTRMFAFHLANGKPLIEPAEILVKIGDETTVIAAGAAKFTFRMPFAMTLDAIPRASLTTASSSGSVDVDVNEGGVSIFSTILTIDANETTSETAATPAVLSDTSLADNAVITIDLDADGANAAGLAVLLRGYRRNRS